MRRLWRPDAESEVQLIQHGDKYLADVIEKRSSDLAGVSVEQIFSAATVVHIRKMRLFFSYRATRPQSYGKFHLADIIKRIKTISTR